MTAAALFCVFWGHELDTFRGITLARKREAYLHDRYKVTYWNKLQRLRKSVRTEGYLTASSQCTFLSPVTFSVISVTGPVIVIV